MDGLTADSGNQSNNPDYDDFYVKAMSHTMYKIGKSDSCPLFPLFMKYAWVMVLWLIHTALDRTWKGEMGKQCIRVFFYREPYFVKSGNIV